jgi:hypothetical protein
MQGIEHAPVIIEKPPSLEAPRFDPGAILIHVKVYLK